MTKMICYFAHPYESIGTSEETEIINELKSRQVTVINPFDGEDKMMQEKYGQSGYYPDPPFKLGVDIWAQDLRRVAEANMLLVHVPEGTRLSGGCGIEMFHAWQLKKFIQIISVSKHPAFAYVMAHSNAEMFSSIEDWKKFNKLRWK